MSHESKADLALAHDWGHPDGLKLFSSGWRGYALQRPWAGARNDNASPKAGIVYCSSSAITPAVFACA
jgi:hypothetical protein